MYIFELADSIIVNGITHFAIIIQNCHVKKKREEKNDNNSMFSHVLIIIIIIYVRYIAVN